MIPTGDDEDEAPLTGSGAPNRSVSVPERQVVALESGAASQAS